MNPFFEIEKNYGVEKVNVSGAEVWPVLRMPIFFELRAKESEAAPRLSRSRLTRLMWIAFKGFFKLFQKCDILMCSNEREARLIGEGYRNKLFHYFYPHFTGQRLHYLELPLGLLPANSLRTDRGLISLLPLISIGRVLERFIRVGPIENETILKAIAKEYSLRFNSKRILQRHYAYRALARWMLKVKQPKLVILSAYYSAFNLALIEAAHERRIPVVEVQHGIATKLHPGYNIACASLDMRNFPDSFLAYSEREKGEVSIVPAENIHTLGHPYLSYLSKLKTGATSQIKTDVTVGLTLQHINEKTVLQFIRQALTTIPSHVKFVLLLRDRVNLERFKDLPSQIRIEEYLDFYRYLPQMDIHLTGSSSCSIEALAMGIPNIFIDEDGFARRYYSHFLTEQEATYYVQTPGDLAITIEKCLAWTRPKIVERTRALIDVRTPELLTKLLKTDALYRLR